jgi:hypothetical protein
MPKIEKLPARSSKRPILIGPLDAPVRHGTLEPDAEPLADDPTLRPATVAATGARAAAVRNVRREVPDEPLCCCVCSMRSSFASIFLSLPS